jgi:two-component system sensor histidine kinase MprB
LRLNAQVLASEVDAPPARRAILKDVIEEVDELTALVSELVELARGDPGPDAREPVELDRLVAVAVERAAREHPQALFALDLQHSWIVGAAGPIERAVFNLLDNAAKWSRAGSQIDVAVRDGTVTVRDRGPGIDPSDLPYVFDRFYRAPEARSMPGSGLGLAVVKQVAEGHGGEIVAEIAEEGGTRMRLTFPEPGKSKTQCAVG